MKPLSTAVILLAATGLYLPAHAASTQPDSLYTTLNGPDCKVVSSNADQGSASGRCPGVGDYKLDWQEGDLRQTINVIAPNGKEFPLELWSTVASGFSALGDKAEWRVKKDGKKTTPIALVVRYNVSEDPDKPEKTTSYLTISKITADEVCVTDVVKPGKDANQQARDLADVAASKPCKGSGGEESAKPAQEKSATASARFLCKADEQVVFGCHSKGKMISLCASSDVSASKGYLQYRFGKPGNIELAYPAQQEPPKGNFWHSFEPYSGGYSERVRFENSKVQYVVFEDMISTGPSSPDKEMHQGVGILMPGKQATSRLCDGSGSLRDGETTQGFVFDHASMDIGDLMDKEDFNFDLELHQ